MPTRTRTPTCTPGESPNPGCPHSPAPTTRTPATDTPTRTPTLTALTPISSPTPCYTPVCPGSVLPPVCPGVCVCYCEATPLPTRSPTPMATETPTASPLRSCDGDACDSEADCLTYGINGNVIPGHCERCLCIPVECGEVEWDYGCCDFSLFHQKPCRPLSFGSDAAACIEEGGYPKGCYGSVSCNTVTGLCESATARTR